MDPSLRRTINNDEIILEFENNQEGSSRFSLSIGSKTYLPLQPEFFVSDQN
jgi:hypothetical protein